MSFRVWPRPQAAILGVLVWMLCATSASAQELDDLLRRRVELSDRLHELRGSQPDFVRSDRVTQLQTQLREVQLRFQERRDRLRQQLSTHSSRPPLADLTKAADLLREIQQLENDKKRAIDDLRSGFYCSRCKETKAEMESRGVAFEDHLERVKGQPIAAPPEVIAKKKAEFDAKIERLKKQLDELRRRESDEKREHQDRKLELERELAALDREESDALAAIRREISDARRDERAAANEEEARWLDEVRSVEDELDAVEVELDRLGRAPVEPLRNPNDELPDQWADADAGVAFVRFGSSREPGDDAAGEESLMPEPYAGPGGQAWTPFETYEIAGTFETAEPIDSWEREPLEFAQESAAISELLDEAHAGAAEGSASAPWYSLDGVSDIGVADTIEMAKAGRLAVRGLTPQSRREFLANVAPSVAMKLAPAWIESIEDVVHKDLTPAQRFYREVMVRVESVWVFGIGGPFGFIDKWHRLALDSIPRFFDTMDEPRIRPMDKYPEYTGGDDL